VNPLVARRLRAHHLIGARFASPVDAVRAFGAVQAQDFPAAAWGLGQRTEAATATGIGSLVDEGAILRTHILRPTWHFVVPDDIGWMLALTAPRLRRRLATRWRQLDLDERTIGRAEEVFADAIAGRGPRTRPELALALDVAGVVPDGQRTPHLIGAAELDGVIVSGPRRRKAFTYALLRERARPSPGLDRHVALGRLAERYFTSHGPAQLRDFVWWSGVSTTEARVGIAAAGDALIREEIDGVDHWSGATIPHGSVDTPIAHLLPNFDEYTVAYRDRSALVDGARPFDASIFSFGSVLANVLLIDGLVRGSWRRKVAGGIVRIELRLLDGLSRRESAAVDRAVERLSRFLEREVALGADVRPRC
jgi:hypothetical protein